MVKRLFILLFVAFAVLMAIPSGRAKFHEVAVVPVRDFVGKRLVPGRLKAMADQLDARLSRGEGLPIGFDGWLRRDYTGPETDPWGHSWYIKQGRRSYTVGTMGPDGKQDTGDDMIVTRNLPGNR
jgi:hypothetical protein